MSIWTALFPGSFGDRMAFAELERAIHVATAGFAESRRALAAAIAERDREGERLGKLAARAIDLEARAVLAVQGGRTDLAEAAAQAIAAIETEREAAQAVESRYVQDVARLRDAVERQRRRLAELDRGRRLARINAAVARTGAGTRVDPLGRDPIGRAEALLDELRLDTAKDLALADVDASDGEALQDRMAEAGIGAPLRPRAADVLKRVEAKAALADSPQISNERTIP